MVSALIDLHVRPVLTADGRADLDLLAVQARDKGLDGIVIAADNGAMDWASAAAVSEATGVALFRGLSIPTEGGTLVAIPAGTGDELAEFVASEPGTLPAAAAIATALAGKGAAVLWRGGLPLPTGAHGVFALVGDDEPALDPGAVQAAYSQRMSCVAGSAAQPGEPRFGAVATAFASPPANQSQLAEALRGSRCFPVELGCPWMQPGPGREAGRFPMVTDRQRAPRPEREVESQGPQTDRAARQAERDAERAARAAAKAEALAAQKAAKAEAKAQRDAQRQPATKGGRYRDALERPGDNRGNRLQREELMRILMPPQSEDEQPNLDPLAAVYGLDSKKTLRLANKSDYELDKINGNRAKGHDPNVMYMPTFDELRTDRQSVTVLFAHTEEQYRLEDSIALRFALSHFRGDDGDITLPDNGQGGWRGRAPKFRRRR